MTVKNNVAQVLAVPDPSVLTTQNLLREIAGLRELMGDRIASIEKAVSVAHEDLVRVPTEVDRAIAHLREVVEQKFLTVQERFAGIATQFSERDTRVDQTAATADQALKAALQAAKELVGTQSDSFAASIEKSDAATEKRFDALQLTISVATAAANDKIDDLKERLTLLEGQDRGKSTAVGAQHAAEFSTTNMWGVVLGVIGTLMLVGSFIITVMHQHSP